MQTILGSGGAIGVELAKALRNYTTSIRLVSRNPKKVSDYDQLFAANLNNKEEVMKAVEGSSICYLTIGVEYDTRVWQEQWPVLIKNVVEACIFWKAKLVFFDNVYAIGGDNVKHITEASPIRPTSKKGEVRAMVDKFILQQVSNKNLDAIIARAPDFFGPIKEKSMLMTLVYDNLVKGKKAQWLSNAKVKHSMGYVPDLAKGTALLGNTPEAYNQIWNLPVDSNALTGQEWISLIAKELEASNKYQVLPGWLMKILGVFIPVLKEVYEMRYQFDRDFYFDSSKFNRKFQFIPTTNEEAIRKTIISIKNAENK